MVWWVRAEHVIPGRPLTDEVVFLGPVSKAVASVAIAITPGFTHEALAAVMTG